LSQTLAAELLSVLLFLPNGLTAMTVSDISPKQCLGLQILRRGPMLDFRFAHRFCAKTCFLRTVQREVFPFDRQLSQSHLI
jgi:hypothetical protein